MADDGLLINFEAPPAGVLPKVTYKGRWKDRLTAKKSEEYGRKKATERAVVHPPADDFALPERSAKRARVESHPDSAASKLDRPRASKSGHDQVISSLFTFNPSSSALPNKDDEADEEAVQPSNAPLADDLADFTSLGLSATIATHLTQKLNIKAPTAIQRKAIQQLCKNNSDAFLQAQTGSGKTLAYLLPIVERISAISQQMKSSDMKFDRHAGLFAIVMAPTRELSKQISTVLDDLLSCYNWIVAGTVIGGEKKKSEKARLRKGLNILVATPGRLVDHISNTEVLDVSQVRWLVLDEGDRLMELGFEQDIQRIIGALNLRSRRHQQTSIPGLPERRTTVLCSATIKADVEQLQSITLKNPVTISIGEEDVAAGPATQDSTFFSAPAQLKQSYAVVPAKQRLVTLAGLLKQTFKRKGSVMKCIVFISCADSVDFHFELLARSTEETAKDAADPEPIKANLPSKILSNKRKIPQGTTIAETRTQGLANTISSTTNPVQMFRLHGSLPQNIRTSTLKAFATIETPAILVCTDVASRGLDLPNVDLVIEYDPPFSKDDHLHRIGRTARAGRDGRAVIFLQPGCEEGYVEILKEGQPRHLTRHAADELLQKAFTANNPTSAASWEDVTTDWQLDVERWVLESPKHLEQARRAYQSHIRAYATHVAAERSIFDMQQLHLGHLAKAFALRDKPGSIRVPGLRPGKDAVGKNASARKKAAGAAMAKGGKGEDDAETMTDVQEARRKMLAKSKFMAASGASEFNLG